MSMKSSSDQGHNAKVIVVNGLSFVASLKWVSLTKPNSYMREARKKGKETGMDIVAIKRSATLIQAGFLSAKRSAIGSARGPELKKMYSLAAALHGVLGDNWIGAFKVDEDEYVVVAVTKGAISPMADRIYDGVQAKRRLNEIGNLIRSDNEDEELDWYVPAEIDMDGHEVRLEDILVASAMHSSYKLRPLALGLSKKEWILIGVMMVLSVALYGGWQWYQGVEERKDALAKARMQARLEELNRTAKTDAASVEALKHPWVNKPTTQDFIENCTTAQKWSPLVVSGWNMTSFDCNGEDAVIHYARNGNSTVRGFVSEAKRLGFSDPALLDNANSAALRLSFKASPGGDDRLLPEAVAFHQLAGHLQRLGINAAYEHVKVEQKQSKSLPGAEDAQEAPAPAPTWKTNRFTFAANQSPEFIFGGYEQTGMRINSVSAQIDSDLTNIVWQYEGVFYAK